MEIKPICDLVLGNLFLLVICAIIFVAAYLSFVILFFVLKRVFYKQSLMGLIVSHIKAPAFFIFLELAAFMSLHILQLPDKLREVIAHGVVVLFIATLGWLLVSLTRAFSFYVKIKKEHEEIDPSIRNTFITQAQIFYRVIVFVIILITIASILMTFPMIKSIGIGLLGSAGIVGIALGLAAKPILLNLMAGFQIAFTKMLKIGDNVVVDGEGGTIEQIFLTHVIIKTSDLRRFLYPIAYFIDKPFQNWNRIPTDLIGYVFLYCDYSLPLDIVRKKFEVFLAQDPLWNKKKSGVDMTDDKGHNIEIRLAMSANTPGELFDLKCHIREKMIAYLHAEHPESLPKLKYFTVESNK